MKYKDYYAALGVPRDADAAAIKKAYRKLAREHHPDVSSSPDAEARFKEVAEAYATLKDSEKRAAYDSLGTHAPGDEFQPEPSWQGSFTDGHAHVENVDLADFLAGLRGGRRNGRQTGPMRGRDFEASLALPLEDAHRGATVNLDLPHEDGSRTFAVTIPPGASQGQRLRLRGKGAPGARGGEPGDLYLHIRLLPHPMFRTDGHDLYFDLELAPWEAALGVDIEVPTLEGPVLLTVPGGSRSGRKLRMRGRGLATGHGRRGDLYAVVVVDVPATLTARERELFEELSRVSSFNPRRMAGKETPHAR